MDKKKKLPLYRLVIGDDEIGGVQATSFVQDPAHEGAFIAFSKEGPVELKFTAEAKKRNVTGPLMIPNKHIYRRNATRGEHEVYFSEADIEHAAKLIGKHGRFSKVNIDHAPEQVDGAYTIEFWRTAIDNERGLPYPKNTLMSTMHVENDDLWGMVDRGEVTGFSIEGLFRYERAEMHANSKNGSDLYLQSEDLSDMNVIDHIKELREDIIKWMTKPAAAPEGEAAKTNEVKEEAPAPVEMNADKPEGKAPEVDLNKRVADLGAFLVALNDKLDAMSKVDHSATAMSAIADLKKDLDSTKAEVTKMAATPVGPVAGATKKTIANEPEHAGMKKLLATQHN